MITLIIFWNIKWKCSLCSVTFKYHLLLCSCCDNHFIFTRAKHQHMVHSVKVSLEMMKQDYFHQSEMENEWYVLLRWTIEPKQTISYSEVSPHTSAQLIIAFSFCCDLACPLTPLCIFWSISIMDAATIKAFRELQNIAHTLFRTPWSMITSLPADCFYLAAALKNLARQMNLVLLVQTWKKIRRGRERRRQALVKEETCIHN